MFHGTYHITFKSCRFGPSFRGITRLGSVHRWSQGEKGAMTSPQISSILSFREWRIKPNAIPR